MLRDCFKTQPLTSGSIRLWPVSIVLNNDNRMEPAVNPRLGFKVAPNEKPRLWQLLLKLLLFSVFVRIILFTSFFLAFLVSCVIQLYENFLSDFEHRINPLSLAELVLIVVRQVKGKKLQRNLIVLVEFLFYPATLQWGCTLVHCSVPFKAIFHKIGPALWKFGSIDCVKLRKKMLFLDKLANFQPKPMILTQEFLRFGKFDRIGSSSKT